jgi:hypothetical protein
MLKISVAFTALVLATTAPAQTTKQVAEPTTPSATTSNIATAPMKPVMGLLREKTKGSERPSDFCDTSEGSTISLPEGSVVLVLRKWPCNSKYGQSFSKELLQVLHAGKTALVPSATVFLSSTESTKLEGLTAESKDANLESWTLQSIQMRKLELEDVLKDLAATAKHGIALVSSGIFDVSEHTEGTGFRVSVHNSTKKTIKYVTFTVLGLNAVGDPVVDRLRGRNQTLRGIGPIEPDETSSYSKDYMWMTDIVESHKILSIKVEYMDGTSKLIADLKPIRLTPKTVAMLTDD